MSSDSPTHRPLERFWPYADLPEQPTEAELVGLDPDLHDVLFGVRHRAFSVTIAFPPFEADDYEAAVVLARASSEYRETGSGEGRRHRARFYSDALRDLRDLWVIVGRLDLAEVLIDDRPLPHARELWLPLIWLTIR
jgi:hypothetical protein